MAWQRQQCVSSAAETVDQRMLFVSQGAKRDLLVEILNRPEVETALVFTRTKYGADKVVRYLRKNNIRGEAIHGNKSQPQREKAMNAFRKGKIHVLVATVDLLPPAMGVTTTALTQFFSWQALSIPRACLLSSR